MEQATLWIAIAIGVIIPFVVWVFNSLITKKIDDLNTEHDETKKAIYKLKDGMTDSAKEMFATIFKRFDIYKDYAEKNFVSQKLYDLAREYQEKQTDQKILSYFSTLTTQINALEGKLENSIKNMTDKMDDVKAMIKELKTSLKEDGHHGNL